VKNWLYYKNLLLYVIPPSILSVITILFYYPSLRYPFLFDDLPTILNNYEIRSTSVKHLLFSSSRWISRLINYFTFNNWKLNTFPYRVTNLVIHVLAGILVFSFVLLICKNVKKRPFLNKHSLLLATITSGLFLLHPVQTQTATYVTQIRLEGLVVLFSFIILIIFALATYTTNNILKIAYYTACVIIAIFAAGTKEIVIVLPALIVMVDWFFLSEGDYKTFFMRLPIHIMIGLVLYYMLYKLGTPVKTYVDMSLASGIPSNRGNLLTASPKEFITPLKYLTGQFRVILHYITMFFWPFGLSFDYGWKIPLSFWSASSLLPFIALIGVLVAGLISFIKNKISLIAFCMAWFFAVILPRSSVIPSTELVCDYKTYLASLAPLFLIAFYLTYLIVKLTSNRIIQIATILVLLAPLGFASMQRNKVWSSRLAFWGDVIEKTEGHVPARAYNNYAVGLAMTGKLEEAASFYKKSSRADMTYAEPVINLALHYQNKKDYRRAMTYYSYAMTLKEKHPEMFNNLGLLHLKQKNYDKAEKSFLMALKMRKHYSKSLFNLGQIYQIRKDFKKALHYYERAIRGDSSNLDFYYNYGKMCCVLGQFKKAIKSFEYIDARRKNYKQTPMLLAKSRLALLRLLSKRNNLQ